jgi:putative transcriptional regulator
MHRNNPIIKGRRHRNRIGQWRAEKGWRQLDLARQLDVYQSEVSEIERGDREPGVYLAKRIARALGKKVEEVF